MPECKMWRVLCSIKYKELYKLSICPALNCTEAIPVLWVVTGHDTWWKPKIIFVLFLEKGSVEELTERKLSDQRVKDTNSVTILDINLKAVSLSIFQARKVQNGAKENNFFELVNIETVAQTDIKVRYHRVLFSKIWFYSRELVFHYLLLFIATPKDIIV